MKHGLWRNTLRGSVTTKAQLTLRSRTRVSRTRQGGSAGSQPGLTAVSSAHGVQPTLYEEEATSPRSGGESA